jgi:hypothetical protein
MSLEINRAALLDCWLHIWLRDSHTDRARLAGVLSGRFGVRLARTVESRHSHCAVIIREICPQPVGQGCCELVVCVASEKHFPIAAYPTWNRATPTEVIFAFFVWACLKIDFAKRLDILKRRHITVEESAGGNLSYIGSPRHAACD